MKTAKNILIATAAILFSLTVNAQNTKSFHYASLSSKANNFVSTEVNKVTHLLSAELESLKAIVKYTPSNLTGNSEVDYGFDFTSIQDELKKDAKFNVPEEVYSANISEDQNEMNAILKELEKETKFNPETNILNNELSDLALELSKDAKYIPSAM